MQDATKQKKRYRRRSPHITLKRLSMIRCWNHLTTSAQLRRGSDSGPARDVSLQPLCAVMQPARSGRKSWPPAPNTVNKRRGCHCRMMLLFLASSFPSEGIKQDHIRLFVSFLRAHQTHAGDPFPVQASSTESSSGLPCLPVPAVASNRKR